VEGGLVTNLHSFRNWPLVMSSVPRVLSPSRALSPSCLASSLLRGVFGVLTDLASNCWVCQMKSCSRFPSFLDRRSLLAWLTTSTTSATSSRPSADSFFEGLDRALLAMKLFRATSIWSFYARMENGKLQLQALHNCCVVSSSG
jgi:hypothetical protein